MRLRCSILLVLLVGLTWLGDADARQVKLSLPTRITADMGAAPASVVLEGADAGHTVSAKLPTFQQIGATNRYTGNLIVDELGDFTLYVYDGSSNLLYQEPISVVRATDREVELGCVNRQSGTFALWPQEKLVADYSAVYSSGTFANRCVFNTGRLCFHTRGECGLVDLYVRDATWGNAQTTSLQVFSGYWIDRTAGTWALRSISEDIWGDTDWNGNTPSTVGWYTFKIERMLRHEPGDFLGIYYQTTGGASIQMLQRANPNTGYSTVSALYATDAAPNYTSQTATYLSAYGDDWLGIRPHCERPWFAFCGHSFWTICAGEVGNTNNAPILSDNTSNVYSYYAANDIANILSGMLDCPVMNCANGGSNIDGWLSDSVGDQSYLLKVIADVGPAIVFFDTAYSDTNSGTIALDDYAAKLHWLKAICDSNGVRLVMLEAPPSRYDAETRGYADKIVELTGIIDRFCDLTQTPYIRLRNSLGMWPGTGELWHRDYQKAGYTGVLDYGTATGDSWVHLTKAGITAADRNIANMVLSGLPITRSLVSQSAKSETVSPTRSYAGAAIGLDAANADTQLAGIKDVADDVLDDTSSDGVVVVPNSVAAAVWSAQKATYNDIGSFGEQASNTDSSATDAKAAAEANAIAIQNVQTAVGELEPNTDDRDLEEVAWLCTLKRSSTGALQSTDETAIYVHPGDQDVRFGWNCDIPSICPGKAVLSSMTVPTSDNSDLTLSKLGCGSNGNKGPMSAKAEMDVASDATPGTYWVETEVTNSIGGGPIHLYAKVIVLEAP